MTLVFSETSNASSNAMVKGYQWPGLPTSETSLVGEGRYDLGFYAGRIYGLCTASFVLLLLLVESTFLYSRLTAALDELKRLATTDPLTGVANRCAFDAALTAHWQRGVQDRSMLSLLMIDIDFFKQFNDRYGHVEGDRCLTLVAECLERTVRHGIDLVARYGGEEFVVLLPETSAASAAQIGQRMCEAVAELAMPSDGSPCPSNVTISVGVARMVIDPDSDDGSDQGRRSRVISGESCGTWPGRNGDLGRRLAASWP